jgi:hypothetical protein
VLVPLYYLVPVLDMIVHLRLSFLSVVAISKWGFR